jgi:hypothetical protein
MKSADIQRALVRPFGLYPPRRYLCVPNVSWGLLPWEADLVVMTPGGYLTEIEIKVSHSDLKADLEKRKHKVGDYWCWPSEVWKQIKEFYFAMPRALYDLAWEKGTIATLPTYAGIIVVDRREEGTAVYWPTDVRRPAARNPHCRPLSEGEKYQLARLGTMRYWTRAA